MAVRVRFGDGLSPLINRYHGGDSCSATRDTPASTTAVTINGIRLGTGAPAAASNACGGTANTDAATNPPANSPRRTDMISSTAATARASASTTPDSPGESVPVGDRPGSNPA